MEARRFLNLDDRTLSQIHYWLRLSPAICMTWTAIGTVLESAGMLWTLLPFALLGGILPGHPFDVLYNHGIRHRIHGLHLPPYLRPRRFA